MRASEKAMASVASRVANSWAQDERRRKTLRKKFPGRVVARRGMTSEVLIEGFVADVRAREAFDYTGHDPINNKDVKGTMPACLVLGSMAYERDKPVGIKVIPFPWAEELDRLDAQMKRIAKRRAHIRAKAWETGVPLTWEQAKAVSLASKEARR